MQLSPDIGRAKTLQRDTETKSEFSATHDVGMKLKKGDQKPPVAFVYHDVDYRRNVFLIAARV